MDKMYQVFVSSTYKDLQEERQMAIAALLNKGCIPIGMEYFPAANEEQMAVIKRLIDGCDYYILIIGGKYGSVEEKSGKSYTQLEYEYALSKGIPVAAFFHKDMGSLPMDKCEDSDDKREKLNAFIKLAQKKLCKGWATPHELAFGIVTSMEFLIDNYPRHGWVRGSGMDTVELLKEIDLLRRQKEELQTQLTNLKSTTKVETDSLMQGSDIYEIVMLSPINPFDPEDSESFTLKWTWDDIFVLIAESFMAPVPARMAGNIINEKIYSCMEDDGFHISGESANTIILQFVALGYMEIRTNEVYQSGVESYYVLTKKGVNYYVSLKAQKKQET